MKRIIGLIIFFFNVTMCAFDKDFFKTSVGAGAIMGYTYYALDYQTQQTVCRELHSLHIPGFYVKQCDNKLHYYTGDFAAWCLVSLPVIAITCLAICDEK